MTEKFTLLLVLLININYICFAQPQQNSKRADSLQVEFLTKELDLTSEESDKLWPVYNNYKNEIRNIRKEDQSDQIVLDEKVLNIRKKYKDDFKAVLGSDERVNKLFVAEKNFMEMLRKELIKRNIKREGT
ncbi:hypothetical protein [Segetibacter aerophilus]|uniref:Sensor of ECF-type sigma factor n=1 Tax=Segetibacter aerophilus TaxID=670293 RepID=A0A512BF05_9BACT|nr:hypothetical protein [Segetibacter aerophilus]GEO10538.1 hypothetical protein SAE01_30340 [Segetibacter aerophilus]